MKLLTWITLFNLIWLGDVFYSKAYSQNRFAPVIIDDQCGIGGTIAFSGLAYFCYDDPLVGKQLYRSNGGEQNWEAVTSFPAKSVRSIRVAFSTPYTLFFSVVIDDKSYLYKTSGRSGDYNQIGEYELGETHISYIASEGNTHFFRTGNNLYAVEENAASVRLLATTTRDGGLYRSDVLFFKGYLYYISSTSYGYWNVLERVDARGNIQRLREFSATSDTIIYPIANDIGFAILNYGDANGLYRVDSNGAVEPIDFRGELVARAGSRLIFKAYSSVDQPELDGKLYATRNLTTFEEIGAVSAYSYSPDFVEFDSTTVIKFDSYEYVVTNGYASGTRTFEGSPRLDSADLSKGLVVVKNRKELHFLDKDAPTTLTKLVAFQNPVVKVFSRTPNSFYVFTNAVGDRTQLWRADLSSSTSNLLTTFKTNYLHSITQENQRLYFLIHDGDFSSPVYEYYLWHSEGLAETTYRIRNPLIELPLLGWLPVINYLLQDE